MKHYFAVITSNGKVLALRLRDLHAVEIMYYFGPFRKRRQALDEGRRELCKHREQVNRRQS